MISAPVRWDACKHLYEVPSLICARTKSVPQGTLGPAKPVRTFMYEMGTKGEKSLLPSERFFGRKQSTKG